MERPIRWTAVLAAAALAACATGPAPEPAEYHPAPANAFEAEFAARPGVKPIRWGGWIETLVEGSGGAPSPDDKVRVHYRGTLTDGTEFDSSYKRGQPAVFRLTGVIPCWTNGMLMMRPGGKARLLCPSASAYGDAGSPPSIPGKATLVFEVELLGVVP
ncbi:MAG: FKBP-type peptidyl-prolyl cis-trans isomerase [Elusimicrobia bacterium]|nr:FKBP-type peptidyl-prolyl cis-trans isomerase [Elusimicrobiota bacterium]